LRPLPFAGITRIRFIGLERFLSAQGTPSDLVVIEKMAIFVKPWGREEGLKGRKVFLLYFLLASRTR
jgi:hypothetical protein